MKNAFRNIMEINFLYSFIIAASATLLPLYLLERNVSVESIGFVMAATPITFLIFRLIFASLGDHIGNRPIFYANAVSQTIAIAIYWIATTPLMFAVGRLMDGVRNSAFWAVNRAEIFKTSDSAKVEKNSIKLMGIRSVGDAAGRIAIGLVVMYISFQNAYFGLGVIGLGLFYLASKVPHEGHSGKKLMDGFAERIMKPRKRDFWLASVPLMFFGAIDYALFVFILPVYMNGVLKMDYFAVGSAMAWISTLFAAAVFLATTKHVKMRLNLLLTLALGALPLAMIFFADQLAFIVLISLFAIGWGMGNASYERIFVWATGKGKHVSTEGGVLMIPQRIAEVIFVAGAGAIAGAFGFEMVFILSSAITIIYVVIGLKFAKKLDAVRYLEHELEPAANPL